MAQAQPLLVERGARGVCTLTLNRPERRNALDGLLMQHLIEELRALQRDRAVRVVILTAAGSVFCGGADLEWMGDNPRARGIQGAALLLAEVMHGLACLGKPVIARVNGSAYGGGVGLIAGCDIAIAQASASFVFSEAGLGIAPVVIAPYVIQAIGQRQAKRYFLSGEPISSVEAERIGLVHRVVEEAHLDETVARQAAYVLRGGPSALRQCKTLAGQGLWPNEQQRLDAAARLAKLWQGPEAREGIAAFLGKRKPQWPV
ncbi:MAG: enoyl-CoA hydratase-related protein [Gammaproteobacteria bacterium]